MLGNNLLGKFDGFPEVIQAYASLSHTLPTQKLQHLVVDTLGGLNNSSEPVAPNFMSRSVHVTCKYEVGVGDGVYFNFLAAEEAEKLKKQIKKETAQVLDFLVCIFYRYVGEGGKKTPLWSDFQYVRFSFEERDRFEIKVHHFKGTRKIPLDILIRKVVDKLNERAKMNRLEPPELISLRGH